MRAPTLVALTRKTSCIYGSTNGASRDRYILHAASLIRLDVKVAELDILAGYTRVKACSHQLLSSALRKSRLRCSVPGARRYVLLRVVD